MITAGGREEAKAIAGKTIRQHMRCIQASHQGVVARGDDGCSPGNQSREVSQDASQACKRGPLLWVWGLYLFCAAMSMHQFSFLGGDLGV
jgi:hypothetical protein